MTDAEAAALLSRKKRTRSGHRGSTTRLLNQATTAMGADDLDTEQLALIKQMLAEKIETLKSLDGQMAELVPEEELEEEIQRADEYMEGVYRVLAKLKKALGSASTPPLAIAPRIDPPPPAALPATTPRVIPAHPVIGPPLISDRVKLPKISLPHFRGNLMKWTAFWDSFNSAVHLNDRLSDIDKFNYLRSLLESTAYDAIAGLALSAANYGEAIEILKKRFGNRQLIISKHMESLLAINAIASDHHLRDLRRLYDQSEANIRSLKALGVEPESYGAMLSSVLLSKLPPELRLIVSRKVSADDLEMGSLLETFEQELIARERANNPAVSPTRHVQNRGRPSTSAFVVTTPGQPACAFCRQSHSSVNCTTASDVEARKKILLSSGRCYNCLRKNHLSRECRSTNRCKLCRGKHHTSICERGTRPRENPSLATSTDLNPEAPAFTLNETTSTLCSTPGTAILLQTARTVIHNPLKPKLAIEVRLLFDGGSQRSYLTERAMKLLKLEPTGEQTLSVATFGVTQGQIKVCPIVSVGVRMKGYPNASLSLHVVPTICEPLSCQPITASVETHDHLARLDLADWADGNSRLPVDVLIGCDHYWDLVTGSICRGEKGPTAIHTKLGWVLSGPTLSSNPVVHSSACIVTTHLLRVDSQPVESMQLAEQLRSFWELESLGIHEEEKSLYDEFASSITFQDGRYKVPLPWKEFHEPLDDNYLLSKKRLEGLLRRLKHTPEILKQYDSTIQEQLTEGIIEPVSPEEKTTNQVHYLPHHCVLRTNKATTKLRVVYDASSKTSGPSLNECLYKGPKFHQLILDLLIRFRSYRVALIADVEKAFLMIAVDEKDRDVLRFVWVDDVTKEDPELRVYRFNRVVFGVSSSPFLLNATVKYNLERFLDSNEVIVKRLLQSTYVDDIISGANSDEEAFELYTQAKAIFHQGGFNLRKFLSNSQPLQVQIDAAERSTDSDSSKDLTPATRGPIKVLGVTWDPNSDFLIFDLSDLSVAAHDLQPTKRNVVSLIGRFYDPLGFLAPITIKFKILFQKLCQSKLDWDCNLSGELLREWRLLLVDLKESVPISIPRSYEYRVEGAPSSYTLCGFCDASTRAYAAVIYLVIESNASTEVKFLVSKTRVAPLQCQTIPRLELLSAFLLSKLVTSVISSLSPTLPQVSLKCYTDSQVALFWIRGTTKEWKPFVNNRVREIRSRVHPDHWAHCPGSTNPADLPSRGLTPLELLVSQLWRRGPEWLQAGFEPSPQNPVQYLPRECALELKTVQSHSLVSTESSTTIESILDPMKYSTLSRLIGVTVKVLRAVRRFKNMRTGKTNPTMNPVEESQEAERLWVKSAQKTFTDFKTLAKQFNLFKDEGGVWRCGGRLANAELPYAVKFPILLPRSHPITSLIVKQAHEHVIHNGVKETLTEIRSQYWIPRGRSLTRKIIHQCVTCRRFEGLPFKAPQPPPLPECRVKETPAFSFTGVDFAGPLMINTTQSSHSTKVWIALFTCYVTRAVHLDVVPDQSTLAFIRCLKRFVARRGLPKRFISDNGKTFKAASKYLGTIFKDEVVEEHLVGLGVTWQFNVERAPWWGGAFERLVRSTKRCLKKMIGRAHFSVDELTTALAEIEAVLNSRPLSYISDEDMEEPLTPSHLVIGRRILSLPDNLNYVCDLDDEEFTLDSKQVSSRVRHLNNVLNHFWRRWRTEYLSCLREVHAHSARRRQSEGNSSVSAGDVVIVKDDHLPRGHWKLGIVQELMKGQDGLTRAATVKIAACGRQHSILRRPIQLLYPLEIHCESTELASSESPTNTENPESLPEQVDANKQTRPKRAAANKADEVRREWVAELERID